MKWIKEQNFTFNVVKTDTITAHKLGINAVPHIVVFDKHKKIMLDGGFEFHEDRFIINNFYSVINKSLEK